MNSTTLSRRYDAVAVKLHWIMAAAIILNLVTGYIVFRVTGLDPAGLKVPPAIKSTLEIMLDTHLILGIAVLLLGIFRLVWRLRHTPPPPPAMNPFFTLAAHVSHVLFYVAIIAIPLSGVMMMIVGYSAMIPMMPSAPFGGISPTAFPDLSWSTASIPRFAPNAAAHLRELMAFAKDLHTLLAYSTAVLLVIHVSAALLHHFWYRDDSLTRMLPERLAKRF